MAYIKPLSPLKLGEDHIYPLTTYDQIILPDGSRWNGESVGGSEGEWLDVNLEGAAEGELALTNADMLGGVPANEYALKTDIGSATVSTGIQMEVLWENPDSTAEFAAQTISIDLSNYTYVLIKTLFLTNEAYVNLKKFSMFEKGETSILSHLNEVYSGNANIYDGIREITVNDDGIIFTDCNYRKINTSDATTTTVENNACIPLKIYGIKGV